MIAEVLILTHLYNIYDVQSKVLANSYTTLFVTSFNLQPENMAYLSQSKIRQEGNG